MARDDLTNLYDRRDFAARLKQESSRSRRNNRPFCLAIIDVDRFKEINDTYGHRRGDLVLMEVAEIIKKSCREMDIACRYGGDEFVVILPEADRSVGVMVGERILNNIRTSVFRGSESQPDLNLTVSIGVAESAGGPLPAEALIESADRALYLAKKNGRNRIGRDLDVTGNIRDAELDFKEFINRSAELEQLKKQTALVLGGGASLVVIAGDAGIGKTRLVTEWIATCYVHKPLNLYGRPFDYGFTPPYHIFFQALKPQLLQADAGFISSIPAAYRSQLARFLPEAGAKLVAEEIVDLLSPDHEKMRLFDAIFRVLELLAGRQPVILFLDDMQWVKEADLELLGYLVRSIRKLPVLIFLTYRQEEIDTRHPLAAFLRALSRDGLYHRMDLKELSERDTARKLQSVFQSEVPPGLANLVFKVTRGNPFYVEEMIKSFVARGDIYFDGKWIFRDAGEPQVPGTISDLLQRRFDGMEEDQLDLLTTAAAIGSHFSLALLQRVADKNEGHVLQLLDKAVAQRIVREEPEDSYAFVNFFLSRTLYERLTPGRRRRLHRQIAEAIESSARGELPATQELLVYHYKMAELDEKYFEYSFQAGKKQMEAYAFNSALAHFNDCRELIDAGKVANPGLENEILINLGTLLSNAGSHDDALGYLDRVMKKPDLPPRLRARTASAQCLIHTKKGSYADAVAACDTAKKQLDPATDREAIAIMDTSLINIYTHRGNFSQARDLAEAALAVLDRPGMEKEYMNVLFNLGFMHFRKTELDRAEALYNRLEDYSRRFGNKFMEANAYNGLATVYGTRNDITRAYEYFTKALAIAEKIGDTRQTAGFLHNIGIYFTKSGDWEQAIDYLQRSVGISQRLGSLPLLINSYAVLGDLLRRRGDMASTQDFLFTAQALADQIGDLHLDLQVTENIVKYYIDDRQYGLAREYCDRARAVLASREFKEEPHSIDLLEAEIMINEENYAPALEILKRVLSQSQENKMANIELLCRQKLGRVYAASGDPGRAIEELERALGFNDQFEIGQCRYQLGLACKQSGDAEQARTHFLDARKIFEKLGARPMLERTNVELAGLEKT